MPDNPSPTSADVFSPEPVAERAPADFALTQQQPQSLPPVLAKAAEPAPAKVGDPGRFTVSEIGDMRQAGFSDDEIRDYVNGLRNEMRAAGFSDQEIDKDM